MSVKFLVCWQRCARVLSRIYTHLLFALTCIILPASSFAANTSILIISNNQFQIHNQVSTLIRQSLLNQSQLKQEKITIEIHHYQNITKKQIIHEHADLIISLGTKAAELAMPSSRPTLLALVPKSSLQKTTFCTLSICFENTPHIKNKYAIYLDQPLSRQLNFLSLLLPSAKKIGVLTAPFSVNKLNPLYSEAKKIKLTLINRHIENEAMVNRQLNALMENIEVLLALPDPLIHNRNNIPYLLLSTYRYNIPVIGFSKAYVNAGAIAAIFSSPEQISRQIVDLSNQILFNPDTITNHYFPPKYFSIAVNKSVAHSLDLLLQDKQSIKSKLLLLEK